MKLVSLALNPELPFALLVLYSCWKYLNSKGNDFCKNWHSVNYSKSQKMSSKAVSHFWVLGVIILVPCIIVPETGSCQQATPPGQAILLTRSVQHKDPALPLWNVRGPMGGTYMTLMGIYIYISWSSLSGIILVCLGEEESMRQSDTSQVICSYCGVKSKWSHFYFVLSCTDARFLALQGNKHSHSDDVPIHMLHLWLVVVPSFLFCLRQPNLLW